MLRADILHDVGVVDEAIDIGQIEDVLKDWVG